MQGAKPIFERRQPRARRLDDELTFGVALDRSLPSIRGHHRAVNVDARNQSLVHECARELICSRIVGHRRQNDREITHENPCTFYSVVVVCARVPKSESRPEPKRRLQKAKPPKLPAARNRRIVHWLVLFVSSIIVVNGLVGDRGLLAMLRARREGDALAATIARQRIENARLHEQARRLREDASAIEEVARRELGLIKPGEKVFIIKDVPPASPAKPEKP